MNRMTTGLALALLCASPVSAFAVCVGGFVGDCEFKAADYPDCSNLSLKGARGVPDGPTRRYAFAGTCRPAGSSLIASTRVSASWNTSTHQALENIEIDGGTVSATFTCENDPFVSNAACSLATFTNSTQFNRFSNYIIQMRSPMTRNKADLAQATALSQKSAASAPPPPPPPPPPPKSKPLPPIAQFGASQNEVVMKTAVPPIGRPVPTVDPARTALPSTPRPGTRPPPAAPNQPTALSPPSAPDAATTPKLSAPFVAVVSASSAIQNNCQFPQPALIASITVKNTGGPLKANQGYVSVGEDTQSSGLRLTGRSINVPPLAMGQTQTIQVPVHVVSAGPPYSTLAGKHRLVVRLNPTRFGADKYGFEKSSTQFRFDATFPADFCKPSAAIPLTVPAKRVSPLDMRGLNPQPEPP